MFALPMFAKWKNEPQINASLNQSYAIVIHDWEAWDKI